MQRSRVESCLAELDTAVSTGPWSSPSMVHSGRYDMVSRFVTFIKCPVEYRMRPRTPVEEMDVDRKLHVDSDCADHVDSSKSTLC